MKLDMLYFAACPFSFSACLLAIIQETHNSEKGVIFSQRIKSTDVTVNTSTQTAKISGHDGVYDVTLDNCTCYDFESRQLPCKHIYRLARELELLDDLPKPNRKAAKAFKDSLPAEIEHYKELYFSGAISGEKLNKIVNALTSK